MEWHIYCTAVGGGVTPEKGEATNDEISVTRQNLGAIKIADALIEGVPTVKDRDCRSSAL
jgi:hypothetical protein